MIFVDRTFERSVVRFLASNSYDISVSISPEPTLSWYRDDVEVVEGDKFRTVKENLGTCHLEVRQLEISDQVI